MVEAIAVDSKKQPRKVDALDKQENQRSEEGLKSKHLKRALPGFEEMLQADLQVYVVNMYRQ